MRISFHHRMRDGSWLFINWFSGWGLVIYRGKANYKSGKTPEDAPIAIDPTVIFYRHYLRWFARFLVGIKMGMPASDYYRMKDGS